MMYSSPPTPLLQTLVRHHFYCSVDWEACRGLKLDVLAREMRSLITELIDTHAEELSAQERSDLTNQLLFEVQRYNVDRMKQYEERLLPATTGLGQFSDWTKQLLSRVHDSSGTTAARS